MKNKNILITGGTGLVGTELTKLLKSEGYNVAILSRRKKPLEEKSFHWDIKKHTVDDEAILFADVIINLAGASVGNKKWTKERKNQILQSRVNSVRLLYDAIEKTGKKDIRIISASAVGYYGNAKSDSIFEENDKPGSDFLAIVSKKWEDEVKRFKQIGIDYNIVRIGVVMSPNGGALNKMVTPVKYGVGAPIGSGEQIMPWIEIRDLTSIFLFLIENFKPSTIVNGVAPSFIDNKEFTKKLAKAMNKPFFMPKVPAFVMKLILGEMSQMILTGNKVSSKKIQDLGYDFKYKDIGKVFNQYYNK